MTDQPVPSGVSLAGRNANNSNHIYTHTNEDSELDTQFGAGNFNRPRKESLK